VNGRKTYVVGAVAVTFYRSGVLVFWCSRVLVSGVLLGDSVARVAMW